MQDGCNGFETGCEAIVGNDYPWASRLPDINYYALDDIVRGNLIWPARAGLRGGTSD